MKFTINDAAHICYGGLMNSEILDLMAALEDAKLEQEELAESGDLEDRLEVATRIADIERLLFAARMRDTGGL